MKRNIIIISVILGALSISCAKENATAEKGEDNGFVKFTFRADREQVDPETRTFLQDNGVSIGWNKNDKVILYYRDLDAEAPETQFGEAHVTSFNDGVATFEGLIPAGMERFEMFALYGCISNKADIFNYRTGKETDGIRTTRIKVEEKQAAHKGSFDPEYASCVAHAVVNDATETPVLKFYNCFSLVSFDVKTNGVQIDSAILQTGNYPAYSYYLGFKGLENSGTDATPNFSGSTALSKSVRIEGPISDGKYFFVVSAVNAVSSSNKNLKITFCNSTGSKISKSASFTGTPVSRNKILDLGSFDLPEDKWSSIFNLSATETNIGNDCTDLDVSIKSGVSWTASITDVNSQPVSGASVSPSSGTGDSAIHVTVPVNKNCGMESCYLLTVTTADEKIPSDRRTATMRINQARSTKVFFGSSWGKSFVDDAIATGETTEAIDGIFFTLWPSKGFESNNKTVTVKGKFIMNFISAEAGKATITVKEAYLLQAAGNKYVQVFRNGTNLGKELLSTDYQEFKFNIGEVAAGDTVSVATCSLAGGYSSDNARFAAKDGVLFSFERDTSAE